MDLKNLKIDDVKSKILAFADKKTLIKFGIGFGSLILFLIIYYLVLNPIVKDKKAKLENMLDKKVEIKKFEKEIKKSKSKIKKIEPDFNKSSALFHSREEVEGLYESLSRFAGVNGLVISKIEKKDPVAVMGAAQKSDKKKKKKKKKKKRKKKEKKSKVVAYYKIPVDYEIKGNFLGYLKFKRAISKSTKMLNFDQETIKIVKNDTTGAIVATGVLTIVGLPDEFK